MASSEQLNEEVKAAQQKLARMSLALEQAELGARSVTAGRPLPPSPLKGASRSVLDPTASPLMLPAAAPGEASPTSAAMSGYRSSRQIGRATTAASSFEPVRAVDSGKRKM